MNRLLIPVMMIVDFTHITLVTGFNPPKFSHIAVVSIHL